MIPYFVPLFLIGTVFSCAHRRGGVCPPENIHKYIFLCVFGQANPAPTVIYSANLVKYFNSYPSNRVGWKIFIKSFSNQSGWKGESS